MRTTLLKATLSLSFVAAAVSGCSGGGTTGTVDKPENSAFREGLAPTVRDGDKLALVDQKADYLMALRSAAIKLTGNYPSLAEIKRVQGAQDQAAEYNAIIDDYMKRPTFTAQMMQFWRDTFKMGFTQTVTVGGQPVSVNMDAAPAFAAQLVVQGKPFTSIVTGETNTCPTYNATTMALTDGSCATNPTVGVLTDPGVMSQFTSSMAFRRTRWVQETFVCSPFPAEWSETKVQYPGGTFASPWPITSISGQLVQGNKGRVDFHDTAAVICANCHTTINHLAPLFAYNDLAGRRQATIQVTTPVSGAPFSTMDDWLPPGEKLAWRFGKQTPDLKSLGAAIAADPDMARCMTTRIWNWAMSRGDVVVDKTALTDATASQLVQGLTGNNWNMKQLIRDVYTGPTFVRF
ncbi:MAG: hypothetical protein U1A78_24725 [Polyangia bacterium]